jgi:phospholipid/cholesterol/gamma-HCH transport system permease protein
MMNTLAAVGRFGSFTARVLRGMFTPPVFMDQVLEQIWTTTTRCLLPVVCVTFPFGMVMALQGLEIFSMFGAERMIASLISIATLRELSPVLASVLVAAQGGSSCAASLGAMRIKEELDATEVMAVDAVKYHVAPRVLALTLSCPILNVAGSISGVAGGYFTAVIIKGESGGIFLAELWAFTGPMDIWGGIIKTTCFGAAIGMISCYHGFRASGGAAGVGRAVNDSVVHSVVAFITMNYFLTSALFGSVAEQ